jgi:hypothetical protein
MGLDQQAYTKDKDGECNTIQDWRKHNALDGWMQNLWVAKGGAGEWNCSELELNAHDIEQETLDFIKEAGKLLSKGEKVYYSAWF